MSGPVAPLPKYLTLPEAVASVCPPLIEDDARRAIEEALCDGRLVNEPRPLWTMEKAQQTIAIANDADRDSARAIAAQMLSPAPAPPTAWRVRFGDGRVNWITGAVAISKFGLETPVFPEWLLKRSFRQVQPRGLQNIPMVRPPWLPGREQRKCPTW